MKLRKHIIKVILDFDGTCTQIPVVFEEYFHRFYRGFADYIDKSRSEGLIRGGPLTEAEWQEVQDAVRRHSPNAGWTLGGAPAAPAAADPYILADESAKLVLRRRGMKSPSLPHTINKEAYWACAAPWRPEALDTFTQLVAEGIAIHIVSNSSTEFIKGRLDELLASRPNLLRHVKVQSDAGKFRIGELTWDDSSRLSDEARARFALLPAVAEKTSTGEPWRPVYLRRGAYFDAINTVLAGNLEELENTVFCGDIWEMDLAMPFSLGALVHLVERAVPFSTYSYERQALNDCRDRGKVSKDLTGLLAWL